MKYIKWNWTEPVNITACSVHEDEAYGYLMQSDTTDGDETGLLAARGFA
jgi:hypothetical protein